jgi:hypothetical protein
MALGQIRVNGKASFTTVYGYQPLIVKVAHVGQFTASTGGAPAELVFGGYEHAMLTVMQFASIVFMGAQNDDSFCVIVDGASANIVGLTAAFAAQGATVTTSSVLNGDGTFTFA